MANTLKAGRVLGTSILPHAFRDNPLLCSRFGPLDHTQSSPVLFQIHQPHFTHSPLPNSPPVTSFHSCTLTQKRLHPPNFERSSPFTTLPVKMSTTICRGTNHFLSALTDQRLLHSVPNPWSTEPSGYYYETPPEYQKKITRRREKERNTTQRNATERNVT